MECKIQETIKDTKSKKKKTIIKCGQRQSCLGPLGLIIYLVRTKGGNWLYSVDFMWYE